MGPDLKFGQPVKKASSSSARQGEPKPNPTATRSEETRISALALSDTNPAYLDVWNAHATRFSPTLGYLGEEISACAACDRCTKGGLS